MSVMASQITSLSIVYMTVNSGAAFVRGIPEQRASNVENISIWWRHHVRKRVSAVYIKHYDCIEIYKISIGWNIVIFCINLNVAVWN